MNLIKKNLGAELFSINKSIKEKTEKLENVSNATSKLYTIGLGGYGYVFHFYGNAYGKYDAAPGVYKTII